MCPFKIIKMFFFLGLVIFLTSCPFSCKNPHRPNTEPEIWVNTHSLQFTTTTGANPNPQNFQIRNLGIETLNYTVSDNADWLEVYPTSGSSTGNTNTHVVTVNTWGMNKGNYTAQITISDPKASNSPQRIGVSLEIGCAFETTVEYWGREISAATCDVTLFLRSVTFQEVIYWEGTNKPYYPPKGIWLIAEVKAKGHDVYVVAPDMLFITDNEGNKLAEENSPAASRCFKNGFTGFFLVADRETGWEVMVFDVPKKTGLTLLFDDEARNNLHPPTATVIKFVLKETN